MCRLYRASVPLLLLLLAACAFEAPEISAASEEPPVTEDPIVLPACASNGAYEPAPITGRLYRVVDEIVSWTDAETACALDEAHLVVIDGPEENAYVFSLLGRNLWIGLSRIGRQNAFQWVNGQPVDYTNWNQGEPNDSGGQEDYIEIVGGGLWNDIPNTDNNNRYVCECDAPVSAL